MKLSIITVNLNNREGLRKTLDSVACQTWRDFEHIIIDGASTDGSVDVIREYAHGFESRSICQEPSATNTSTHVAQPQTHQHISQPSTISHQPYTIKWLSEPDTGIYNAMNKGIRMAKGEYCLFLNSGDYLIDVEVLNIVFAMSFKEDVVYGYQIFNLGDHSEVVNSPRQVTLRTFIRGSIHHSGNAFIKRDSFGKWGMYDESLKIVSDWKWFLMSIGLGDASVRYIDVLLSVFDCHGISFLNDELCDLERNKTLHELVPFRILEDYNYFQRREQQLISSRPYRFGKYLLIPFRAMRILMSKKD